MLNETWKPAVIEGTMVLIGVLLALLVDEWREDQEFQQLVSISEGLVLEEISANHERLTADRDEIVARRAALSEWGKSLDLGQPILSQLDGFPTIPAIFVNRSAWTMANNSQLTEYINYEFYDSAFQLYEYGEALRNRQDVALELMVNVQGFDATQTEAIYKILELYFDDIIDNLSSLIRSHQAVIVEFSGAIETSI